MIITAMLITNALLLIIGIGLLSDIRTTVNATFALFKQLIDALKHLPGGNYDN